VVANWTREEIILACDLVSRNNWQGLRANTTQVQELSRLLQAAKIHPPETRHRGFRSPSSVQRKTYDIATQHPKYHRKPTRGNQLDAIILFEFLYDTARMQEEASSIRKRIENSIHEIDQK